MQAGKNIVKQRARDIIEHAKPKQVVELRLKSLSLAKGLKAMQAYSIFANDQREKLAYQTELILAAVEASERAEIQKNIDVMLKASLALETFVKGKILDLDLADAFKGEISAALGLSGDDNVDAQLIPNIRNPEAFAAKKQARAVIFKMLRHVQARLPQENKLVSNMSHTGFVNLPQSQNNFDKETNKLMHSSGLELAPTLFTGGLTEKLYPVTVLTHGITVAGVPTLSIGGGQKAFCAIYSENLIQRLDAYYQIQALIKASLQSHLIPAAQGWNCEQSQINNLDLLGKFDSKAYLVEEFIKGSKLLHLRAELLTKMLVPTKAVLEISNMAYAMLPRNLMSEGAIFADFQPVISVKKLGEIIFSNRDFLESLSRTGRLEELKTFTHLSIEEALEKTWPAFKKLDESIRSELITGRLGNVCLEFLKEVSASQDLAPFFVDETKIQILEAALLELQGLSNSEFEEYLLSLKPENPNWVNLSALETFWSQEMAVFIENKSSELADLLDQQIRLL